MLTQPTVDKLHQMRLAGMAEGFMAQRQLSDYQSLPFEERFGMLVDQEWTYRQDIRLSRLLRGAKLRLPASLEDIDYQQPRGLDRALIATLASGQWLLNHQKVIFTGPTGIRQDLYCLCPSPRSLPSGPLCPLLPGAPAPGGSGCGKG